MNIDNLQKALDNLLHANTLLQLDKSRIDALSEILAKSVVIRNVDYHEPLPHDVLFVRGELERSITQSEDLDKMKLDALDMLNREIKNNSGG